MVSPILGCLNPNFKKVFIHGAGISGLIAGYYLKKKGYDVTLFEKEKKAGGLINTLNSSYGLCETAANALFTNEDVWELLTELKLEVLPAHHPLKRYLIRKNKMQSFPLSFLEIMTILPKLFRSTPKFPEMTVFDFFAPLLGEKICDEVLTTALQGIYATSCRELSFHSIFKDPIPCNYFLFFKNLLRKKNKNKATSVSFKNGMQELIKSLEKNLEKHIIYEATAPLTEDVNHIICTHASTASEILSSHGAWSFLSPLLKAIPYIPLKTATYITSEKIKALEGAFGVLFSPLSHYENTGILHNSAIFPHRVRNLNWRSYTFISHKSTEHETQIRQDLTRLAPSFSLTNILEKKFTFWEKGIPCYNLKRQKIIEQIKKHPTTGLILFANYTNGISLRDIITHAKKIST
ncbi:MAG: FAD-dependent oxidoreductase [Bacteriovoracaceae bacterium]|nr:FAD-dependent oxidoreductase [Bacteriovoracaceae bacterium]